MSAFGPSTHPDHRGAATLPHLTPDGASPCVRVDLDVTATASVAPTVAWEDSRAVVLSNLLTQHKHLVVLLHLLRHSLVQRISDGHLLAA